jgi:hypothetical protein
MLALAIAWITVAAAVHSRWRARCAAFLFFAGQRLKANRADNFEPLDQCGFAKACPFKIWP